MSFFRSVPLVCMMRLRTGKRKKEETAQSLWAVQNLTRSLLWIGGSSWPFRADRQVSWLETGSPFLWSDAPTGSAMTSCFVLRGPGFPPGTTSADSPARSWGRPESRPCFISDFFVRYANSFYLDRFCSGRDVGQQVGEQQLCVAGGSLEDVSWSSNKLQPQI